MSTKDSVVATMQKQSANFRGGIKTLKSKLAGQNTKKTDATQHKNRDVNWWSAPYCCTHGVGHHDREACFRNLKGQMEKATSLDRIKVSKRGILEGAWH